MRSSQNLNLVNYNAYRLTAHCAKAFFPECEADFLEIYSNQFDTPRIILGNGNNIILIKDWYEKEFIILNGCFDKVWVKGTEIIAEAGATMLQLSKTALRNSLSGLEIFYDIPSSVGGAVVMNAGTGHEEIKDLVSKVRYLDLADRRIKMIFPDQMEFEYRNSIFQKRTDKIVLKVWFSLKPGDPAAIQAKMEKIKQIRWAKQPREYPNCGSVFKRPVGRFVGPMLDELGLKGFMIGGARISERHSGFIINTGNATGKDILALIEFARKQVKERFDVDLEIEQRIV